MGRQALAHLQALNIAVPNVAALDQAFTQTPRCGDHHPLRGSGTVLGARIPDDIGDDRTRFADAKALKVFAGTAPVTALRLPIHYFDRSTERSLASHGLLKIVIFCRSPDGLFY